MLNFKRLNDDFWDPQDTRTKQCSPFFNEIENVPFFLQNVCPPVGSRPHVARERESETERERERESETEREREREREKKNKKREKMLPINCVFACWWLFLN